MIGKTTRLDKRESGHNAIRIKAKMECRLYDDRDETVNHIKRTQKEFESSHEWLEQVIQGELCQKLKFDHTTKWNIHEAESVLEKYINTHKVLWHFEI